MRRCSEEKWIVEGGKLIASRDGLDIYGCGIASIDALASGGALALIEDEERVSMGKETLTGRRDVTVGDGAARRSSAP